MPTQVKNSDLVCVTYAKSAVEPHNLYIGRIHKKREDVLVLALDVPPGSQPKYRSFSWDKILRVEENFQPK